MDKQVLTSSLATEDVGCYTVGILRQGKIVIRICLRSSPCICLYCSNETHHTLRHTMHCTCFLEPVHSFQTTLNFFNCFSINYPKKGIFPFLGCTVVKKLGLGFLGSLNEKR